MTNLLVLGATGFVGRTVCEKLVERSGGADGRIRVATRRLGNARHLQLLPTVELAEADVHDDRPLAGLLRDTDVVINLVAVLHGSAAEFDRVHVKLPARLATACKAAGVRRVIVTLDVNRPDAVARADADDRRRVVDRDGQR